MYLSDCHGHFFDSGTRRGVGLIFDCPLCVKAGRREEDRYLLPVHFKIALDGKEVPEETRRWVEAGREKVFVLPRWTRTGETIDGLTLSPSIDASVQDHGGHQGWHGFVQHGKIVGGGV